MKVILFGASGMVGQGVLRECLLDPEVEAVLSIGRSRLEGKRIPAAPMKLHPLVRKDLYDYSDIGPQLAGYDTCFFCLGVSSAGMKEQEYRRLTYDLTLSAAEALVRLNPAMTFIYVSGTGTDSSEQGRSMWARVKGQTENALLRLPFKGAYMFRPGGIQPLHGIRSKTRSYQLFYTLLRPILPVLVKFFPQFMTTTEVVGRAMLRVAKEGYPKPILEAREISAFGL